MSNTQTNFPTSLPETCFAALDSTDEIVVLVRGEMGYRPTGRWVKGVSPQEGANALNNAIGVTKAQAAAMKAGAMFGWDAPAADPRHYDEHGNAIRSKPRNHRDAR